MVLTSFREQDQRTATIDPEGSTVNPRSDQVPELINDRFRILHRLGRGGMAVVYLAEDLSNGKNVAIKLMNSSLTGTAKRRFTREFSTIASLKHPHLIDVYEYGETTQGPFFAMEYFDGATAGELIGQPLEVILQAINDLCEAIEFVHAKRIIHRDIKPANILVRRRSSEPGFEIRLSDFGLAKFANTSSSLTGDVNFLGTVAYCAPEQIMREELDHRADLYSLGIVVYELVSGIHPFAEQRGDIQALISAQITHVPRGLAELRDDIPPALDRVVARLMAKDPDNRPVSTNQLRAVIAEVLGWSEPTETTGDDQEVAGRFVGRNSELARAENFVLSALAPTTPGSAQSAPEGRILFFSGEAGIGKTSMVRRAARKALVVGGRVYDGRCFEGNIAPFQPFAEILRQILSELEAVKNRARQTPAANHLASATFFHAGDSSTQIDQVVKEYATDLLRVGPELRSLLASQIPTSPHEVQRDSQYIFRSLAAFFLEIARQQPLCLIIEDVHWADRSTIDLLRQIASGMETELRHTRSGKPHPRLAICCTTRNGEEYRDALDWVNRLCESNSASQIELKSIEGEEISEFVGTLLQSPRTSIDDEILDFVSSNCFGNPFYITQTIRQWRDYHTIKLVDRVWRFTVKPDSQSQVFSTMRQAVSERLQKLSENARRLMGSASIIGINIDMELLQEVCGDMDEFAFLDALDELLGKHIFLEGTEAKKIHFSHDLYRESANSGLSKPRKERLHKMVASALESRGNSGETVSPGQLAEHFAASGERLKAFRYFLEAAMQAIDSQAFKDAAEILRKAEMNRGENLDDEHLYEFEMANGKALFEIGQKENGIACYKRARELAGNRLQAARAAFGIAKTIAKFSTDESAVDYLLQTIRCFGKNIPKSRTGKLFGAVFYNLLTLLTPLRLVPRDKLTTQEHELIGKAFAELAFYYLCVDTVAYAYNTALASWTTLTSKDPDCVCAATSKYSGAMAISGKAAIILSARVFSIAERHLEQVRHPATQAYSRTNVALSYYAKGELAKAEHHYEQALKFLSRTRDWYHIYSLHMLRHIRSLQGDAKLIYLTAKKERAAASQIDDPVVTQWGKYGEADAHARMGQHDEAHKLVNEAVDALGTHLSRSIARAEQARVALQRSDYESAVQAARTGIRFMFEDLFVFDWPSPSFCLLVEGLAGPNWSSGPSAFTKKELRQAVWAAYRARFFAIQFPNIRAQTYRACGRVAAAKGKHAKALQYFDHALVAAQRYENRGEYARALIDISLVADTDQAKETCVLGLKLLKELHTVLPQAEREIIASRFGIECPEIYSLDVGTGS